MLFTAKQSVEKSDYNRYTTLPKKIYCLFSLLSKAMLVFSKYHLSKGTLMLRIKKGVYEKEPKHYVINKAGICKYFLISATLLYDRCVILKN